MNQKQDTKSQASPRRPYRCPALINFGTWDRVTLGSGTIVSTDNPSGNTKTGR